MKHTSRLLCAALSVAMVAAFSPAPLALATTPSTGQTAQTELAGTGSTAAYYKVLSATTHTVAYQSCEASGTAAAVPATVTLSDGTSYAVTQVSDNAFFGKKALTSISVASNVKTIGARAFEECSSVRTITLSSGVTSIGKDAFFYCSHLTNITLPSTLSTLGAGAFFGCESLKTISIPKKVTAIGSYTFSHCDALTTVTGCANVKSIGQKAFWSDVHLTKITTDGSLRSIGELAFYSCMRLKTFNFTKNLKSIGKWAFEQCSKIKKIYVACKTLSVGAFEGTSAKDVTIAKSVVTLKADSFNNCGAKTLTIGKNVKNVSSATFYGNSIKCYKVAKGNKHFKSIGGVLYSKSGKTLVAFPTGSKKTSYTVAKGTKVIAASAFVNCNLTKITLPKGLKTIKAKAFAYCASLTKINLPASVSYIGKEAFNMCNIKKIVIPAKVKTIRTGTFADCSNLKSVKMTKVKTIQSEAFNSCDSLKKFTIPAKCSSFAPDAIGYGAKKFIVAKGNKYYKVIKGVLFSKSGKKLVSYPSSRSASSYTVPKSVTVIGKKAFANSTLEHITLPAGLKTIQSYAFFGCEDLARNGISIPSKTVIKSHAIGYTAGDSTAVETTSGVVILGTAGSAAQKYALANDFAFASQVPKMSASTLTLGAAGSTATVSVTGDITKGFHFYSSDKNVVTVDRKTGVITAVGGGTTDVVAAMGSYYLKCAVTVGGEAVSSTSKYQPVTEEGLKSWESDYYAANTNISFTGVDNPAITCYTGDEYVVIKAALRHDKITLDIEEMYGTDLSDYIEVSKCLKYELSRFKQTTDIELYSGTGSVAAYTGTGSTLANMEASIGKTTTNVTMISTSLCMAVSDGFSGNTADATVMYIHAPAGATTGGYLYKFSRFPSEYELLLSQDAKFKITDCGVRYVYFKHWGEADYEEQYAEDAEGTYQRYLEMEYIGQPAL